MIIGGQLTAFEYRFPASIRFLLAPSVVASQALELSPKLRQPVKTHFSLNGELSYGNVSTEVHEGV